MAKLFRCTIFTLVLIFTCSASRVLELTDKFSAIHKDGSFWFVKFYAPWCGHCKRLEPIWGQVAQALHKTNIRVGRVDCTRFANLCREFSVSGFPTILFLKSGDEHTYAGDRTKDDLVNFAVRMAGPPVQEVTRPDSLSNLKYMNHIYFMYVGERDGPVWDAYNQVAGKFQPHGFFYSINKEIAENAVDIWSLPSIFVYKENLHYFFPVEFNNEIDQLNTSLYKWINQERFETFQKITRGNIHEVMQIEKFIVIAVVEENKLHQISHEHMVFRDMIESVVRRQRDKYHKHFQFGWVGDPELGNSIAMQFLTFPSLIVVNSTTHYHYIPEDEASQLTADAVDDFLENVLTQNVPAYGGDTYAIRLYRAYFEAKTSLYSMWNGNPVLTTVLFGLPLGFLCLILYSICCSDIFDANEEDEEPLLQHEKRE